MVSGEPQKSAIEPRPFRQGFRYRAGSIALALRRRSGDGQRVPTNAPLLARIWSMAASEHDACVPPDPLREKDDQTPEWAGGSPQDDFKEEG